MQGKDEKVDKSKQSVEERLNLLICKLVSEPPREKSKLISELGNIIKLLTDNKPTTLMDFLLHAKTLEWVLASILQFKTDYDPESKQLNGFIVVITEILLVDINVARMMINFGMKTPSPMDALDEKLNKKYYQFFDLYVSKKTGDMGPASKLIQSNYLTRQAKEQVKELNLKATEEGVEKESESNEEHDAPSVPKPH